MAGAAIPGGRRGRFLGAARAALDRILAVAHRAAGVSPAATPMGLDGVSPSSVSEQEVREGEAGVRCLGELVLRWPELKLRRRARGPPGWHGQRG
jgi:hypothetical protein